jgi:hypothetical protein
VNVLVGRGLARFVVAAFILTANRGRAEQQLAKSTELEVSAATTTTFLREFGAGGGVHLRIGSLTPVFIVSRFLKPQSDPAFQLTDWATLEGGVGLQAAPIGGVWTQLAGGYGLRGLWIISPETELALRTGLEAGINSATGAAPYANVVVALDGRMNEVALELGAGIGAREFRSYELYFSAAPRWAAPAVGFIGVRTQVMVGRSVHVDARLTYSVTF